MNGTSHLHLTVSRDFVGMPRIPKVVSCGDFHWDGLDVRHSGYVHPSVVRALHRTGFAGSNVRPWSGPRHCLVGLDGETEKMSRSRGPRASGFPPLEDGTGADDALVRGSAAGRASVVSGQLVARGPLRQKLAVVAIPGSSR